MTKDQIIAMAREAGYDMEAGQRIGESSDIELFTRFASLVAAQAAAEERKKADQDAKRYRWLRTEHWEKNTLAVVLRPKDNTRLGSFLPSEELLDDAIDAAIRERK